MSETNIYSVGKLIEQARLLAADYKKMMGKPLPGVSNEIAEHDAAKYLNLILCDDRSAGYDALRKDVNGPKHIQIKARAIFNDNFRGQRIGQIKLEKEWDSVILVLMDANYQTEEIFEATRDDIFNHLDDNVSRMKRGAMSVAKFRIIGKLVWTKEGGLVTSAWQNL